MPYTTIPGGQIIGGMGGRIYLDDMGTTPDVFAGYNATTQLVPGSYLEIDHWTIAREWINAECTHSGTWAAITRRLVAYDWRFECSLPFDQASQAPDAAMGVTLAGIAAFPASVNFAVAFFLGDVVVNPEAAAMRMTQRMYYAPAAMIRSCRPVLDAARDVIRYQVAGEGNSRLWLLPDDKADCTQYLQYLSSRGWAV